jgi:hypothetical protein
VLNGGTGALDILDRYSVNLVAVEPDRALRGLIARDPRWLVVLDEAGSSTRKDPRTQLFVAVRKRTP